MRTILRTVIYVLTAIALITAARSLDGSLVAAQPPFPPPPSFDVPGLPAFGLRAVEAGSFHTCGIDRVNRAWCWGLNDRGQLGNGTRGGLSRSPVLAGSNFNRYRAISAGGSPIPVSNSQGGNQLFESHTCAVTDVGSIDCWGANGFGQLGNGTFDDFAVPVPIMAVGRRFVAVSAGGRHTCAVTEERELYCWGANSNGQLGEPTGGLPSNVPVLGGGGLHYSSVSAGEAFTCGSSLNLTDCGGSNTRGQLGNGTTTPSTTPLRVGVPVGGVSAGFEHACGIAPNFLGALEGFTGDAYCWGRDDRLQLGYGPEEFCGSELCSRLPARVVGDFTFSQLSAGGLHTCGLTRDHQVVCWGDDRFGQMGIGVTPGMTARNPTEPALMFSETILPGRFGRTLRLLARGREVTAGGLHSCAIAQNSQLFCWGNNNLGQVGAGTDVFFYDRPVAIDR